MDYHSLEAHCKAWRNEVEAKATTVRLHIRYPQHTITAATEGVCCPEEIKLSCAMLVTRLSQQLRLQAILWVDVPAVPLLDCTAANND
jgi:hypothetical protein